MMIYNINGLLLPAPAPLTDHYQLFATGGSAGLLCIQLYIDPPVSSVQCPGNMLTVVLTIMMPGAGPGDRSAARRGWPPPRGLQLGTVMNRAVNRNLPEKCESGAIDQLLYPWMWESNPCFPRFFA